MDLLLNFATIFIVGRCVLSLTPPGRPGYHEARELPITLATSWLMGLAAMSLTFAVANRLGVDRPSTATITVPWLLVAIVKWRLGPGAMVPRHEPQREPVSGVIWMLLVTTIGILIFAGTKSQEPYPGLTWLADPGKIVSAMVLTAVYVEGLRTMQRPMWPAVLAALLVFLHATEDSPFVAMNQVIGGAELLAGGGAVFALASWRRADRRAMILSVLCFAALPLLNISAPLKTSVNDLLPMLCGLAILCSLQPEASRLRLIRISAVAAVASTLLFYILHPGTFSFISPQTPYFSLLPLVVPLPIAFALGIRKQEPEFVGLFLLVSALLAYGLLGGSYREAMGIAPLCIAVGISRARSTIEASR